MVAKKSNSKKRKNKASVKSAVGSIKNIDQPRTPESNTASNRLDPPPAGKLILGNILESFNINLGEFTARYAKLFESREKEDAFKVVWRLLFENAWEKAELASLYHRWVNGEPVFPEGSMPSAWSGLAQRETPLRLFVESGSTVLYVISALSDFFALHAKRGKLAPEITTNNNLAAWVFLRDSVHSISPSLFSGFLERKYCGIFPFYPRASRPRNEPNELLREEKSREEQMAYAHCRIRLAARDVLLLAASRVSLVFGPMVGSRENAIFKHATYSACVPPLLSSLTKRGHAPDIHLFITSQKLVVHHPDNIDEVDKGGTRFHSILEEESNLRLEECYPVFDIPKSKNRKADSISCPFSTDLCPEGEQQNLVDGTEAVQMGEGRFRICRSWHDLFAKAKLEVKIFISFEAGEDVWIQKEVDFANGSYPDVSYEFHASTLALQTNNSKLGCIRIVGHQS